ncbi:hypothetical protein D3C77_349560 [compost metagenome]
MVNTEESFEIDVSEVFYDADGDTLTFTVNSSNSNIAKVEAEGAIITVFPYGMGSTIITITADDGSGGIAEASFHFGLYSVIAGLEAEVSTEFIILYWDNYWDEDLIYHIYIDDELFETISDGTISIVDLKPDTAYKLRVVAVNYDKEIMGFADLLVTTSSID